MDGANGTRGGKKSYFSPVYYGNAQALKIVKSFKRVGMGSSSPKAQKKSTPAAKPPKKKSSSDESSLTSSEDEITPAQKPPRKKSSFDESSLISSEDEITPAPRLSKDNPVIKAVPELFDEAMKDTEELIPRENGNTVAPVPKASKSKAKDQDSQPISPNELVDITFPCLHLGPDGDILALRCDMTCPKRSEPENSPLPGAHLWCRAHQKYHCHGTLGKTCDFTVLCAISVEVYSRMQVERYEGRLEQREQEDHHAGMEVSSDEDMNTASQNLVATQSSGTPLAGSTTHSKENTESTVHDSSVNMEMEMDLDESEDSEDNPPRKRVKFSNQNEVNLFREDSIISP